MKTKDNKKEKTRITYFGVPLTVLMLVAVVFSHIGWWVENIARVILVGKIDARFYILPFISAYGTIPFAFHGILRSPDDIRFFGKRLSVPDGRLGKLLTNALAWICMVAFVFAAELLVGNAFDILFGVKLWNYSGHPLHFTRYTGVLTSLGFGTGAFVLYKTVYKWLLSAFSAAPKRAIGAIACVLSALIILDTANMILYTATVGEAPMLWSFEVR